MEAAAKSGTGMSKEQHLKAERDRFVALAFCWAEFMFELDANGTVLFAVGATSPALGRQAGELVGRNLKTIVTEKDRFLFDQLLNVARKRGRIEHVSIRLEGNRGMTPPLDFAGYCLDELNGHFFLAFKTGAPATVIKGGAPISRDLESGLYDGGAFADVATNRVEQMQQAGQDVQVTMMAMPEMGKLSKKLGDEAGHELMASVGACLKANSVHGDSAARLAEDKFSFIHDSETDIEAIQSQITELTRLADPEGKGVEVKAATVDMNDSGVSPADMARGLVYTINKFREQEGAHFDLSALSTNISALASEAAGWMENFHRIISNTTFDVAFQPIVDCKTGEIHHYEALARFKMDGSGDESPYRHITFAEETGLIHQFDIAMARKVVEWLSKQPRNSNKYRLAINISGHSVGTLSYVSALHDMLKENKWLDGKLMFEITESARMTDLESADEFIQSLRKQKYHVCLDDFGAGAASFQYLSTLDVDVVKLDGSAVRNAMSVPKGRAFLSALTELCKKLGVETIAEMIDDPRGLEFVRECGVDYVQGYLFGKPSKNIKDFEPLPGKELFSKHRRG